MLISELLKITYWVKDSCLYICNYISMMDINILQGFTLAILTILAPLFIGFLINIRTANDDSVYKKLDYSVVLNYFINLPLLFTSLTVAYVSILMFRLVPISIKFFLFIVWIICNFTIIRRIFLFYEWLRGYKDKYRKIYLNKLHEPMSLAKAFQNIWEVETKNNLFGRNALEIFFNKLNLLAKKKQFESIYEMLSTFVNNMHKRDINNLIFGKFIANSLQLYIILKNMNDSPSNSNGNNKAWTGFLYSSVPQSRLLITQLFDILLKKSNFNAVSMVLKKLYNLIMSQPEEYKDTVKNDFFSLYEDGIPILIFENPSRMIYLPGEWQITEENIKSRNEFTLLWLYNFLEWIYRETRKILILYADIKSNKELLSKSFEISDRINVNLEMLFPPYDSSILFDIFLLFVWCNKYRGYEDVTSLYKLIIQTSYFISSPISFSTPGELSEEEIKNVSLKKMKERETFTIAFASILLKNKIVNIPVEKLQECIKEIENIECESKDERTRKKRLVQTYNTLLKLL